jgi:hypothetical protein
MPSQERRGDVGASIWTVFEKERSELNYKSCREEYQIKKVFVVFVFVYFKPAFFIFFCCFAKLKKVMKDREVWITSNESIFNYKLDNINNPTDNFLQENPFSSHS